VNDIDKIRNAPLEMYCLSIADDPCTFDHDEAKNIKKLRLDAQGLNVAEPAILVLGGITHSGAPRALDIQRLRDAMSAPNSKIQCSI
jgi:hypothetical protein